MDINTILIHKGIGNVLFGMSKQDILEHLDSDHTEEVDEEGDIDIIFPGLSLSFTLWKEFGYKLGYIESAREDVQIFETKLTGKSK